jgi:hypothetical protein
VHTLRQLRKGMPDAGRSEQATEPSGMCAVRQVQEILPHRSHNILICRRAIARETRLSFRYSG